MPRRPRDIYLKKITLINYRAYHGANNVIDLSGNKSLIVLGENGSGKSSLYFALKDFFTRDKSEMRINTVPYRNFFATTGGTAVKIKFSDNTIYEWSDSADSFPDLLARGIDTTKGFIDYKSLLQTYYGQQRENTVNIFNFLVKEILAEIKPLGSSKTIGTMWREISSARPNNRRRSEVNALRRLIDEFNDSLHPTLATLQAKTQEILNRFNLNLQIEITFGNVEYNPDFSGEEDIVHNQVINLIVDFYGARYGNHHHFLNEARLSAIAISLFFASFQLQPAGRIKFVVLDDVLIGLDMQNREPVLDILRDYFDQYQVFLFTFDRIWFDKVKIKFPTFQKIEIHSLPAAGYETIAIRKTESYLEKAEAYYASRDIDTAANYIRKYYEQTIKDFCDRKKLKIGFQYDLSKIQSSKFWEAIVATSNSFALDTVLKLEIESCQSNVNNPLSHAGIHNVHSSEVRRAIDKVKELNDALAAIT